MSPYEFEGQFGKVHRLGLVNRGHSTHIGGHIRQHKINFLAIKDRIQILQWLIFRKITLDDLNTVNRVHFQNIQCHNPAVIPQQGCTTWHHPPGAAPRVNHDHARFDQTVLFLQLQQFKSRT